MAYEIADEVIRQAQEGDEQARRRIIETFQRPIRVSVARFLRARTAYDVDDHLQDIYMKVFSHIGEFDFERKVKFSTWLYTIVRNHCFDVTRRKRLPSFSLFLRNQDEENPGDWLPGGESTDKIVVRREFGSALLRALGQLPSELARIFKLREFDGWEFHSIAKFMRLPVGTVKSRHYRALDLLRFRLRDFRLAS